MNNLARRRFSRCSQNIIGQKWSYSTLRYLSSSEVATALRPFYFLVHPDLFGRYPKAQLVNESSLKLLNSHLDSLVNEKRPSPVNLQFYVKNKQTLGSLNTVALKLNNASTRATVHGILSEFDLPTNYVDNLPERRKEPDRQIDWHHSFYAATGTVNPEDELYTSRKENLYSWLIKNMGEAERRLAVSEPIREDIVKLREGLLKELKLTKLTWVRDLSTTHLRGCLQGLTNLTVHHPEIKEFLDGRGLHFGNETGVSLEGSVVLSTSEVRNQWLQAILRVPEHDVLIKRIPDMQKAVSNTLRNIQVTHRKYQPYFLAENYSQQLQRLVTSLGDYHGTHGFPKSWPESLSSLQLVVESAAGPLMLSPTGQILAPSSCPPWLLVNFITENMENAEERIQSYESIRDHEKVLLAKCKEDLGLDFLEKNDSIAPDMMIECLERLLASSYRFGVLLCGARLWITTYYTVMLDGELFLSTSIHKRLVKVDLDVKPTFKQHMLNLDFLLSKFKIQHAMRGTGIPFPNEILFATFESVRKNPFCSECFDEDIGKVVGEWLKHAKGRDEGTTSRKKQRKNREKDVNGELPPVTSPPENNPDD